MLSSDELHDIINWLALSAPIQLDFSPQLHFEEVSANNGSLDLIWSCTGPTYSLEY
jgi:hypothetical protein